MFLFFSYDWSPGEEVGKGEEQEEEQERVWPCRTRRWDTLLGQPAPELRPPASTLCWPGVSGRRPSSPQPTPPDRWWRPSGSPPSPRTCRSRRRRRERDAAVTVQLKTLVSLTAVTIKFIQLQCYWGLIICTKYSNQEEKTREALEKFFPFPWMFNNQSDFRFKCKQVQCIIALNVYTHIQEASDFMLFSFLFLFYTLLFRLFVQYLGYLQTFYCTSFKFLANLESNCVPILLFCRSHLFNLLQFYFMVFPDSNSSLTPTSVRDVFNTHLRNWDLAVPGSPHRRTLMSPRTLCFPPGDEERVNQTRRQRSENTNDHLKNKNQRGVLLQELNSQDRKLQFRGKQTLKQEEDWQFPQRPRGK